MLPRLSYYVQQEAEEAFRKLVAKAFSFVLIVATAVSIYFTLYAKESILLLAGKDFLPSVGPMVILMPTVLLIGLSNITGIQILTPRGEEIKVVYSVTAGAVLGLCVQSDPDPEIRCGRRGIFYLDGRGACAGDPGIWSAQRTERDRKRDPGMEDHPWTCRGDGSRIFCRSAYQSWRFLYIMCVGTFLFRHIWYNFTDVAGNIRNKYIGVVSEAREEERVNHVPKREKSLAETLGFYVVGCSLFTACLCHVLYHPVWNVYSIYG